VRLAVYTTSGRMVTTLYSGALDAGRHCFRWQACDSRGMTLPSGVYFVLLQAGNDTAKHKMVLLR
jgi:flagellar hook assembly protein FlgD